MTAEIINLRQYRKAKARDDKDQKADDNRAKYGLSKKERARARAVRKMVDARLNQLKRGEAYEPSADDLDPGNVS
ncbi:MAG: DUF4169 family protein [Pseudomonadota bacterium]